MVVSLQLLVATVIVAGRVTPWLFISLQVRQGLVSLSQRILGPNTLVQAALPDILKNTPPEFFNNTVQYIQVGH